MDSLAPIDVARLEEPRQARAVSEIAKEAEPIMGGWMCRDEPGSWCNQACGLALDAPVHPADVDRLVDYHASAGIEPRIELCPFAHESLVIELSRRGFTLRQFESVLYLPLRDARALSRLPDARPQGVEIRVVDPTDPEDVDRYVRASSVGFFPDGHDIPEHFFDSVRRTVRHPRSVCFLATLDGKPVGGGGLEVAAIGGPSSERTTACLFGVSVLPEARRRGIQQALIAARVRHAHDRGAAIATIGSKPGIPTERNAARLGFQMAYTKAVLAMAGAGLTPSP